MAINNITGLPSTQTPRNNEGSQVARDEPTTSQSETGRPSSVDTVSLSDTASRMHSLQNTLAELPVVDTQRVENIQRAIADGTFEIDPSRVAEKMLGFESDLSG
jgi:negative regulator of flagellin synthesis FlgM